MPDSLLFTLGFLVGAGFMSLTFLVVLYVDAR